MPKFDPVALYRKHYVENDFERLDLFQRLADRYTIQWALYPGSFVHIAPSVVFPTTVYVDMDKRAKQFFESPILSDFIAERKMYRQAATVRFHHQSYTDEIFEKQGSFDLLISQWAGFISRHCKHFLKVGGLLLANNSHGDVSMATLDDEFSLVAVVHKRDGQYRITDHNLESYLVPKSDKVITRERLEQTQRGVAYKKSASMYIFERIS